MPLQPIPIPLETYVDRSLPISNQRLINMYAAAKPAGAKSSVALYPTPGLSLYSTIGTNPIRGILSVSSTLYVVCGERLYTVASDGTATTLGMILGENPVSMATSGTQVAIVSDSLVYYVESGVLHTLGTISDCTSVVYTDGYFVFSQGSTQKFFVSALNDVTTYDATEFTLANSYYDNLVALAVADRNVWAFGEKTTEIYANVGALDFPFRRIPSGIVSRGCLAAASIARYKNMLFWLGDDSRVYRSAGYQEQQISTDGINTIIEGWGSPETTVAFCYEQADHAFYVLNNEDGTVVYCITTGRWQERVSWGLTRWRPGFYAYHDRQHIVGDVTTGKLYTLQLSQYEDVDDAIVRTMQFPPLFGGDSRMFMQTLYVDFETGIGLETGQGSDPQAMLQFSDDGGRTWSSELWAPLGAVGNYKARAIWRRLGTYRERILRVSVSDPVPVRISGAYAEIEAGDP